MPPPSDIKLLRKLSDVLGLFHFICTSAGNSANVKDIGRLRRHRKANKAEGHFGGDSATLLCRRYQVRTERRLHRLALGGVRALRARALRSSIQGWDEGRHLEPAPRTQGVLGT